ncbi:DUF2163 domain-containing protein [Pseudotabrizicola alkalilacus]|uniref:DUF2163 domain-containing protein n=1 Tax=Pseudotabrizicola alkalilacus TaxID=2305252 RepID=A0A411YY80_9RHOB|nr:DUF2163 domain-containing protein [Pseudotabrizicola alkalilacus]
MNWQAVCQRILMRRSSIGEIRCGPHAFTVEVRALAPFPAARRPKSAPGSKATIAA